MNFSPIRPAVAAEKSNKYTHTHYTLTHKSMGNYKLDFYYKLNYTAQIRYNYVPTYLETLMLITRVPKYIQFRAICKRKLRKYSGGSKNRQNVIITRTTR